MRNGSIGVYRYGSSTCALYCIYISMGCFDVHIDYALTYSIMTFLMVTALPSAVSNVL
jgi:hypothetical protein